MSVPLFAALCVDLHLVLFSFLQLGSTLVLLGTRALPDLCCGALEYFFHSINLVPLVLLGADCLQCYPGGRCNLYDSRFQSSVGSVCGPHADRVY